MNRLSYEPEKAKPGNSGLAFWIDCIVLRGTSALEKLQFADVKTLCASYKSGWLKRERLMFSRCMSQYFEILETIGRNGCL